jgi:membrane associated rhomboid family serine protease
MFTFIDFMLTIVLILIYSSVIFPLPLTDIGTVRYKTLPVMTYLLITINGLVYLGVQLPTLLFADRLIDLQAYVDQLYWYGYHESLIRSAESIGAFTTFTSIFMHGSLDHLVGNMVYLWAFGRRIEDACGAWRYLLFYLTAGVLANMGTLLLNPFHDDIPGIGASGAIAGLLGAYLILFPGARINCMWIIGSILRIPVAALRGKDVWVWTIPIPAFVVVGVFVLFNALPSFSVMSGQTPLEGVNTIAHLIGFIACLFIFLFVRKDLLMRFLAGRSL